MAKMTWTITNCGKPGTTSRPVIFTEGNVNGGSV